MTPLETRQQQVETALRGYLHGLVGPAVPQDSDPAHWQRQIDDVLAPGRYLIDQGGKRWRPLFLALSCEAFGAGAAGVAAAPAIELAHSGSLIVDDIEDGAQERRGVPAAHLHFGLDAAINAGNLLYFLPFEVIEGADLDGAVASRCCSELAWAMRQLHFGQGLDIRWHRSDSEVPSTGEYFEMCRLKSGSLPSSALRMGAWIAGTTPPQALGDIGSAYGACFQIIDDVRNLTTGNPGKRRGDDLIEGKRSLPLILHLKRHPESAGELWRILAVARSGDQTASQAIDDGIGLLAASGAITEATKVARDWYTTERQRLLEVMPGGAGRDCLVELADSLMTITL